jgi:hypothetical protein
LGPEWGACFRSGRLSISLQPGWQFIDLYPASKPSVIADAAARKAMFPSRARSSIVVPLFQGRKALAEHFMRRGDNHEGPRVGAAHQRL